MALPVPSTLRWSGVSVFDLDRTLLKGGTYTPFLLHSARLNAPWRLLLVPVVLVLMAAYKLGSISRRQLKEAMHRTMLGTSIGRATIAKLAERFADQQHETTVYPEARALIERERAAGRLLIMATAAHRFYAVAIADRLGIEHVVATESVWQGDDLTPGIDGTNCHSRDKLDHLVEYLRRAGIDRGDYGVRFYSDDHSDLPIFAWCDEPVAVNPSPQLHRIASRQGWGILDWR